MITELRRLPAPAKLNLFLHVTGRRPDGYHLLETAFELVDLQDSVDLHLRDDGQILREQALPGVAPEDDLVVRAARLLARTCAVTAGVSIRVDKRIPMGGGLGGGSSDAATVLLGLNRLWRLRLSRAQLIRLGLTLGADVPFFVFGQSAYAQGIGERLRAWPQPTRNFVILAPAVSVPTAAVFADPELTRDTKPLRIFGLSQAQERLRGRNDLEPVVRKRFALVTHALGALERAALEVGAKADSLRMSGSGSCVFLPVATAEQAGAVKSRLEALGFDRAGGHGTVFLARSMARHPLRDWAFAQDA